MPTCRTQISALQQRLATLIELGEATKAAYDCFNEVLATWANDIRLLHFGPPDWEPRFSFDDFVRLHHHAAAEHKRLQQAVTALRQFIENLPTAASSSSDAGEVAEDTSIVTEPLHKSLHEAQTFLDKANAVISEPSRSLANTLEQQPADNNLFETMAEATRELTELVQGTMPALQQQLIEEAAPDDDAPTEVALGPTQQTILVELLKVNATHSDSCVSADKLAHKPTLNSTGNDIKHRLSNLAKVGLLASKKGPGGGYWLTSEGIVRADRLTEG